jgi:hypothetical protein
LNLADQTNLWAVEASLARHNSEKHGHESDSCLHVTHSKFIPGFMHMLTDSQNSFEEKLRCQTVALPAAVNLDSLRAL